MVRPPTFQSSKSPKSSKSQSNVTKTSAMIPTPTSTSTPKNWPSDIIYIDKPVYHSSVPKNIVQELKKSHSNSHSRSSNGLATAPVVAMVPMVRPPSGCSRIQMITSPSHPANGQRGLFATKKIEPNTLISYYIGEVHAEDRVTSDYDLSLLRTNENSKVKGDDEVGLGGVTSTCISIGIDASRMGNEGRFVNDYRGIAPRANAVFKEVRMEPDGQLTMGIWSGPQSQGIKKGEEIVVSYGKAWWASRRQDHELVET